jgi:hypothetical protein
VLFVLKQVAFRVALGLVGCVQVLWWLRARLRPDPEFSWILATDVGSTYPWSLPEQR